MGLSNVFLVTFMIFYPCHQSVLDDLERSDIGAVRYRLEDEKEKRLLLQNDVEILMMKVAELQRRIESKTQGQEESGSSSSPDAVSFFASYSGSHTSLQSGQVIAFDTLLTDNGGAYSPRTGIFRAPRSGTYHFSVNILVLAGNSLHGELMKNGDQLGRFYTGTGSTHQPVSLNAVINLEEGDEVYVREHLGTTGKLHGGNYCYFSGALIGCT